MTTLDEDLHAFLLAQAVTTLIRQSRSLSCSAHMQISLALDFKALVKKRKSHRLSGAVNLQTIEGVIMQ